VPRIRVRTTAAVLVVTALGGAQPAGADMGGAAPAPAPRLTSVDCRVACAGPAYARAGSTVRLRGRDLAAVTQVTFLGRRAPGDEVTVAPQAASPRRVLVTVPDNAAGGKLTVATADGVTATPSAAKLRVERIELHPASSGPGPAIELGVAGRKVYFDGERQPTVAYVLHDSQPVQTVVQVIRVEDGAVIREYDQGPVEPDVERTVSWDGTVDGVEQPAGRYAFAIIARGGDGTTASTAQATPGAPPPADSFVLLGYKFPIRGKHDFGSGSAAFGGGRGHQGQDVFARCGTPLVAARGGVVKMKRFQSRAGNYLVIDAEQSDVDMAYMHLRDAALVEQGDRVRTGQLIGYVGDTGRAFGCHLHFEEWSGPGWYTGGSAFDPLPDLQAWDELS
jgi:murein DD-endopeptidase MepM/ murein hydrolase activator NlpD